jgi:ferredoxin
MTLLESVKRVGEIQIDPPEFISFQAKGRCLLLGTAETIERVIPHLSSLDLFVSLIDDIELTEQNGLTLIAKPLTQLQGWFGAFHAEFGSEQLTVDTVLDLSAQPMITTPVAPLGYFAPRDDAQALAEALQQLPEMVGVFDKPRFFEYVPSLCAHSRRGVSGCSNCIDACPAEAIGSSGGEQIVVNPNLCQGCGSCTVTCPSGAIRYALPTLDVSIDRLRRMLTQFRQEASTQTPYLLIHDLQDAPSLLAAFEEQLPSEVIPFSIEEIGALGMAFWLTAIAYGVHHVMLWDVGSHSDHDWQTIKDEVVQTNHLISSLGYQQRIHFVDSRQKDSLLACCVPVVTALETPAQFAGLDDKRRMITLALTHLHEYAPAPITQVTLDQTAAFGEIKVKTEGCTLCMSCVSVCPMGALVDGVDKPQLKFIEDRCVQCGMCETACPEKVISLQPRYRFDRTEARQTRLLHEEPVFHCISCQKPFATQKMIDTMMTKLAEHPMFQGEAKQRLKMCEDCRVKAMMREGK